MITIYTIVIKDSAKNPVDFLSAVNLMEFDVVDTDFRGYLVKNWEKIYNTHSFEILENNNGHIKVRLMCGQKDFYIAIDKTRCGNIRGYITSMNGYCCKFKQKSVNFRIELQF